MMAWLAFCYIILDELLRREGLGNYSTPGLCVNCTKGVGEYRCSDCLGDELYCLACTLSSHRRLPLHRIQVRDKLLMSLSTKHVLDLGLGERLFQAHNPRETWPHRQSWAPWGLLSFSCRTSADTYHRPFWSPHCSHPLLQMFSKWSPRQLPTTPTHRLVPSITTKTPNGLLV